ncbi:hypothetical protein SO802_017139 [Lithocarpus litseifolius]|uniref:Uncharacterized protein n=1 Tax=Lithocarpus litseifolius TaxID=425828 RepID=A0AAW2D0P3_9ROSI
MTHTSRLFCFAERQTEAVKERERRWRMEMRVEHTTTIRSIITFIFNLNKLARKRVLRRVFYDSDEDDIEDVKEDAVEDVNEDVDEEMGYEDEDEDEAEFDEFDKLHDPHFF